jgi:hypothetical protein
VHYLLLWDERATGFCYSTVWLEAQWRGVSSAYRQRRGTYCTNTVVLSYSSLPAARSRSINWRQPDGTGARVTGRPFMSNSHQTRIEYGDSATTYTELVLLPYFKIDNVELEISRIPRRALPRSRAAQSVVFAPASQPASTSRRPSVCINHPIAKASKCPFYSPSTREPGRLLTLFLGRPDSLVIPIPPYGQIGKLCDGVVGETT